MNNAVTLKIAVMGAGAVGCYYGGMLARAGHNVVLVARPPHVDAMTRSGLRLQTAHFDEYVRLTVSADAHALQDADVVLFCVKSNDTESAGALILPFLKPGVLVLCLQNGVDNADRLRAQLQVHDVVAVVVYVATEMASPGHVKHNGRGELVLAPSTVAAVSSQMLVKMLVAAGVPADISSNVRGALWAKLTLNCAYNAVSAITRLPYGKMTAGAGMRQVTHDVVAECLAVAAAEGVDVPGDMDAAVRKIAETMQGQHSSTAQDLARGKRTEIDYLNGFIVRRGEALGVATPANRVLWALVKLLEAD